MCRNVGCCAIPRRAILYRFVRSYGTVLYRAAPNTRARQRLLLLTTYYLLFTTYYSARVPGSASWRYHAKLYYTIVPCHALYSIVQWHMPYRVHLMEHHTVALH